MPDEEKYGRPIGALFDAKEGGKVTGQINLKRADLLESIVVSIYDDRFFHVNGGGSLHGISEAGKISLLDCVRGGMLASTSWGDFSIYKGDVVFRYAIFGKEHILPDEKCIRCIQFSLEGVETSVFMGDKFLNYGHINSPDDEIIDAIMRNRPEYLKGDLVHGKAMVSYFTGNYNLLPETETVLGKVHACRTLHTTLHGLGTKQTPYIEIDFDDSPTTLEDAWEKLRKVRQFFGWMMGYVPGWKDIRIFTVRKGKNKHRIDGDGFIDSGHEVFGPKERSDVSASVMQHGTLIDASRNPDHFMEVMKNWLARNENEKRNSANARFFGSMRGGYASTIQDRIVSAANTFDLLPPEDKPELPSNRRIYLREIVEHRLEEVLIHFGENRVEGIRESIRLAVMCRNHYTHGPEENDTNNVDFTNFGVVHYLSCTLEFIYGASELLLCGWDDSTAVQYEWHPIGGYVKMYEYNRSVLNAEG